MSSFSLSVNFSRVTSDQHHRMLDPCSVCQDGNFEVWQGGVSNNFFHLPPYWISITKTGRQERILRLETWNFAWGLVLPKHMLRKNMKLIRDQKCNLEQSSSHAKKFLKYRWRLGNFNILCIFPNGSKSTKQKIFRYKEFLN